MPPIRFKDSPQSVNTHSKKRKTTPDIKNKSQRNREDIKEDCTSDGDEGLSAYELERLENIRQNQAFLSSMNILQVEVCLLWRDFQKGILLLNTVGQYSNRIIFSTRTTTMKEKVCSCLISNGKEKVACYFMYGNIP
ncbi:hypothetical protein KUCAC02_002262 [Chaenocephalus aceratus]|uniref:Uncharacterized protein n=1 Tax=Chaenocephalus aceratus TaxID=36190 RepID=A0ACB9XVL6_CHAAC|nr:hypothetical protein KUCAC02_002262 [Chaenocephalus aceratus]